MASPLHLGQLPWPTLAVPLALAEDAVARLDERLNRSPLRDGWIARSHFADACSTLWLQGELVHPEDLVLHDAGMDVRGPTHALTQAHLVLRSRRQVAASAPGWALSTVGLAALKGGDLAPLAAAPRRASPMAQEDDAFDQDEDDGILAAALADLAAASARAQERLNDTTARRERDPLVYDPDWDEAARLDEWRRGLDATRAVPPVLAASLAAVAWDALDPLPHRPWLGRQLAAALLRERGKTRVHLAALAVGVQAIPRQQRHDREPIGRLLAALAAFRTAAETGLKDHDRWFAVREQLQRKLVGRRSTSRLPQLIDFVMTRPMVTTGTIARALGVTERAAQDLVADLGLRESTGRKRYKAWSVL